MSTVHPVMSDGGNTSVQTSATGTNYVAFPIVDCHQLTISNDTGEDIEFRQDGAGEAVTIFSGTYFPIYGLRDASTVSIRRKDTDNAQVTVKARWED